MTTSRERQGRPTQFHGVPPDERALDSQGNRLPWALEWADDHPNARLQKRIPEEKGSFGKSTRRKGSSRATRTQTPAKKENPALDGFEAALKFDAQNESQNAQSNVTQAGLENGHTSKISMTKQPTQVTLYGFPPETQWAALNFYERVSGGMICEDYEREPPAERRRYQSGLFAYTGAPRRPLTIEERTLAMKYQGGASWIKVTFDSREAADRALSNSPHVISGYWVYAQLFNGQAPAVEGPILFREDDRQLGLLGAPRPPQKTTSLGPAKGADLVNKRDAATKSNATLPRSFVSLDGVASHDPESVDEESISSVTASSATVLPADGSDIRYRNGTVTMATQKSPAFTHFPSTPRTVLRPAAEALLPQLSWSERLLKRLAQGGWIPGDFIGTEVPKKENGEFDWDSASLYWRICFQIDHWIGSDLCGMKDQ